MQTSVLVRGGFLAATCLAGFASQVGAQTYTAADSGWVRLFNGTNFDGLYSRTYGSTAPLVTPPAAPYSIEYSGTDTATIRVATANPQGNIGTIDTTFSHYRMRVEAKFDVFGTTNAGLTYHTRESVVRMHNNWPRSIEFQFKQDQTGSAYSIQQVTFNTRATGSGQGSNYSPTAPVRLACEIGCNGRWYKGSPLISNRAGPTGNATRWLHYELVARGADSATHIVEDTVVMELWNIRIHNDSTKSSGSSSSGSPSVSNFTPSQPFGSGGLGLQAEGTTLRYRRWEIMQFPPSTPKNEPFLHRLFLKVPGSAVKPENGTVVHLETGSIGTIPWVKIEYQMGSAAWQTAIDSTPNTGSYNWTAPQSVPDSLRFRVSSADYVWPDSTGGLHASSIRRGLANKAGSMFTVRGGELLLPGVAEFNKAEVRDASGRLVRALPVSGETLRWDLADTRGAKVRPGLYFVRLTGRSGIPFDARVMVL